MYYVLIPCFFKRNNIVKLYTLIISFNFISEKCLILTDQQSYFNYFIICRIQMLGYRPIYWLQMYWCISFGQLKIYRPI